MKSIRFVVLLGLSLAVSGAAAQSAPAPAGHEMDMSHHHGMDMSHEHGGAPVTYADLQI